MTTGSEIVLLLIDDDDVDRKAVSRALKTFRSTYELREARDGRTGLELAKSGSFDCILMDYNLPDMTGFELLDAFRTAGIVVPIVILTGSGNEAVAVEAMKRGAHDYLRKSHLGADLLARSIENAIEKSSLQRKLVEAHEKLERLALYDGLTGLGNRNLFYHHLPLAIAIAEREGSTFPLLFMDLDRFKAANDAFGHEGGDAILAGVGIRLREISRGADVFFRLGGDEFTAILHPGSDGEAAARRIIAAVAQPFQFGMQTLDVGISVGVANYPSDGTNPKALVGSADGAMYKAKKAELGWARAAGAPAHG
jgi:diguanylate cyclase (GGDEF)-like protein